MHPVFNIQSRARTHAVLMIGFYELLGNPTTQLIEPSGPPYDNESLATLVPSELLLYDIVVYRHLFILILTFYNRNRHLT